MRVSDGAPTAADALLVLPASDRDITTLRSTGKSLQTILQVSAGFLQGFCKGSAAELVVRQIAELIRRTRGAVQNDSAINHAYLFMHNN